MVLCISFPDLNPDSQGLGSRIGNMNSDPAAKNFTKKLTNKTDTEGNHLFQKMILSHFLKVMQKCKNFNVTSFSDLDPSH